MQKRKMVNNSNMRSIFCKSKIGAIEMSIGTIVVVVLAMSMLILGLVLIKSIFKGTTSIADMTTAQLKNQVATLFGEDKKLVIYPDSGQVEIKQGATDGFGIGIKNLITGSSDPVKFSYEVSVRDDDLQRKCDIGEVEAKNYISTGRTDSGMVIAPGDLVAAKILLTIPSNAPMCTIRYRIDTFTDGNKPYASEYMAVTIVSK